MLALLHDELKCRLWPKTSPRRPDQESAAIVHGPWRTLVSTAAIQKCADPFSQC